jgi:PAS domain S-box-containing protein
MKGKSQSKKLSGGSFSALLSVLAEPVVIIDAAGNIIAANDATEKYTEIKAEDSIGKNFFEIQLFDKESTAKIKENLEKRLKGFHIDPYEVKLKSKNGKAAHLEVTGKKIVDHGKVLDVIVFHDVTERSRHQKELQIDLKKSEQKFKTISDATFDGIIVFDATDKIRYWNAAAQRIFGLSQEEVVGKNLEEIPKHVQKFLAEIKKEYTKNPNANQIREISALKKNGSTIQAEISLSPLNIGEEELIVATVRDITEHKNVEFAWKQQRDMLDAVAENTGVCLAIITRDYRIFWANKQTRRLFGSDIQNKNCYVKLRNRNSICPNCAVKKIFAEEKSRPMEISGTDKKGEKFCLQVTASPVRDKSSSVFAALTVGVPVTYTKEMETKVKEAREIYQSLLEQAPLGVVIVDPETASIVKFNEKAHKQLGYSREEFEKLRIFDFEAKEKASQIKMRIKEMLEIGEAEFETLHRTKNGELRNVKVTTRAFKSAGKNYLHCIFYDITEIKKAENALKESEELSRAIVANAPIGIATSDNTYHFVNANQAFCSILGYTEEELRGLTFKDISHPDEIERGIQSIRELEKGKIRAFVQEKRYIKKDGSIIIGRVTVNAIRNIQGKPLLFIIELEDITKPIQLKEELRSSEERFRAISTSAMDAIVLCDNEGNVIYWNPAAEKTFGFSAEEAVNKKITNLIIPAGINQKHAQFVKAFAKKHASKRHTEATALKKDGGTFPVDLAVTSLKINGKSCVLAIIRDITEWKAMEEALRQERDFLESVAANTNIVLSIISRDYRIIWANQTAKKKSHCDNIENKYCYQIFGHSPSICKDCGVKRVFENGEKIVRRDYCVRSGEREIWAELVSTPIKDKNGSIIAALEVAMDITERKNLQNKLAQYSQRLEEIVQKRTDQLKKTQADLLKSERLAAIGELAGMIGHDLRNPLTGIKNSVYYLKKKGAELPQSQAIEMIGVIEKCVDYSNRIINDLLDYSKEIHLLLEEVSPRELLIDSLAMIDIPEKIKIKNKLKDEPKLNVDTDKIKRVIINLAKNAFDAMPEGGQITVDSKEVKDGLEISFSDTGIGIDDETLQKLFTPLFTTKAKGMGFGLAICKRIIEAHGGQIAVSTVKGQGTTFTLTIPFKQKKAYGGENVWINIPESSLSMTTKQSEQR